MSKEYASALFSLAREAHVEDEILDELKVVAKLMEDNPEILEFLAAPNISKRERCGALKKALDSGKPWVIECAIDKDAMVHPMVPGSTPITDFLLD